MRAEAAEGRSGDVVGEDGRDPVNDLRILGKELKEYKRCRARGDGTRRISPTHRGLLC